MRDARAVRRFRREARTATALAHPNIVKVFEIGQDDRDGSLFMVQELLRGRDLRAMLDRRGTLAVPEALSVIVPVMGALITAFMIIRSSTATSKPENVFLVRTPGGDAELPGIIDFGLSKVVREPRDKRTSSGSLTRAGTVLGTPQYMSPEQAGGDDNVDERTDIWSVAVMLYEMLCGRCPFVADTAIQLMTQIVLEVAPRIETFAPDVPKPLADAIHAALAPDREKRTRTVRDFLRPILEYETAQPFDVARRSHYDSVRL